MMIVTNFLLLASFVAICLAQNDPRQVSTFEVNNRRARPGVVQFTIKNLSSRFRRCVTSYSMKNYQNGNLLARFPRDNTSPVQFCVEPNSSINMCIPNTFIRAANRDRNNQFRVYNEFSFTLSNGATTVGSMSNVLVQYDPNICSGY